MWQESRTITVEDIIEWAKTNDLFISKRIFDILNISDVEPVLISFIENVLKDPNSKRHFIHLYDFCKELLKKIWCNILICPNKFICVQFKNWKEFNLIIKNTLLGYFKMIIKYWDIRMDLDRQLYININHSYEKSGFRPLSLRIIEDGTNKDQTYRFIEKESI